LAAAPQPLIFASQDAAHPAGAQQHALSVERQQTYFDRRIEVEAKPARKLR